MTTSTVGRFAWHCHHDKLWEALTGEYEVRLAYIRKEKPKDERVLRERLFKLIPDELLPLGIKELYTGGGKLHVESNSLYAEGDKLRAEGDKLRAEGEKLYAEGDKLRAEGEKLYAEGDKLYAEGNRLWAEGEKLYAEGDSLWAEGDELYAEKMQELHTKLCPDCPWDGQTIFTKKE